MRVVVFGDIVLDVGASRASGPECVRVSTGGVTRGELLAAGATSAFHDLARDTIAG